MKPLAYYVEAWQTPEGLKRYLFHENERNLAYETLHEGRAEAPDVPQYLIPLYSRKKRKRKVRKP